MICSSYVWSARFIFVGRSLKQRCMKSMSMFLKQTGLMRRSMSTRGLHRRPHRMRKMRTLHQNCRGRDVCLGGRHQRTLYSAEENVCTVRLGLHQLTQYICNLWNMLGMVFSQIIASHFFLLNPFVIEIVVFFFLLFLSLFSIHWSE